MEPLLDNIDHIVLSKTLTNFKKTNFEIWNAAKLLSDHIGVSITLE